jgi:hypothetical protein
MDSPYIKLTCCYNGSAQSVGAWLPIWDSSFGTPAAGHDVLVVWTEIITSTKCIDRSLDRPRTRSRQFSGVRRRLRCTRAPRPEFAGDPDAPAPFAPLRPAAVEPAMPPSAAGGPGVVAARPPIPAFVVVPALPLEPALAPASDALPSPRRNRDRVRLVVTACDDACS